MIKALPGRHINHWFTLISSFHYYPTLLFTHGMAVIEITSINRIHSWQLPFFRHGKLIELP
jgi:hypothetical protein